MCYMHYLHPSYYFHFYSICLTLCLFINTHEFKQAFARDRLTTFSALHFRIKDESAQWTLGAIEEKVHFTSDLLRRLLTADPRCCSLYTH